MGKGTPSMGKMGSKKTHVPCRRCGKHAYNIRKGACASCGGIFNNYAIVPGVDEVLPVDVYIAGCPPRPEGLIHGIITLHEKIKGEKLGEWA